MPDVLTVENLILAMEKLKNQRYRAPILFVSQKRKAWLEYIFATVVVWELRGARRMRGPDGETWIEKKWRTANIARGSGNKSKRRMGLVPVRDYFGSLTWEVPHASR